MRIGAPTAVIWLALVAGTSARAQRFEDLGPSLGLPVGAPGATTSKALVAGLSAADLDHDGDDDLVATDAYDHLTVWERTASGFAPAPAWGNGPRDALHGHTLFDMDGDGDLDGFVGGDEGAWLLENQGGRFVDVTASHLPTLPGWTMTATAADLDGDGDLDLIVARYIDRVSFPSHRCMDNLVLANDGSGFFRDVSAEVGVRGHRACSFMVVAIDLDDDLDLDLVTVNDFGAFIGDPVADGGTTRPSGLELWEAGARTADGLPTYREVAHERGLVAPIYGMGVAIEDLDQNGRLDLFATSIGEPLMFERGDDGRFVDVGHARGLGLRFAADRHLVTWVARALDLDRDGRLDVLATSGSLSAADFIGNGGDMQPLWVRQSGDGAARFGPVPLDQASAIAGSSARDVAVLDVDGDGRPELAVIHMHGGISLLVDRDKPPPATRLQLVPNGAPGAAGALVTLTCGEAGPVVRTRHVAAGGDYGNADLGRVEVAFGGACDAVGRTHRGVVRWPGGATQTFEAASAQLTTIVEAPSPREAADVPEAVVWVDPPTPVLGHALEVYARFAAPPEVATVTLGGDTIELAPADGAGLLQHATLWPPSIGATVLAIDYDGALATREIVVTDPVSDTRSEVVPRDLVVLDVDRDAKVARLRLRLRDDNGLPSGVPFEALALEVDGVLRTDVERNMEGEAQTLGVPHAALHDGSRLQIVIDGVPRFAPLSARQLHRAGEVAALVSLERSWCAMSEPRLRADGVDRGTVIVQLLDAAGTRLPDFGLMPRLESDGVVALEDRVTAGYGGWVVPVRAGLVAKAGELRAWLPSQGGMVRCPIALDAPLPLPPVAVPATVSIIPPVPTAGRAVLFRFVPQGPDGRALGSGVRFTWEVEGGLDAPLTLASDDTYVGLGRYELMSTPSVPETLTVRIRGADGALLGERQIEVADPAAVVEEVAEVVEVVEVVEPVEAVEVVGGEEVVEVVEEVGDEEAVEDVADTIDIIDVADTARDDGPDDSAAVDSDVSAAVDSDVSAAVDSDDSAAVDSDVSAAVDSDDAEPARSRNSRGCAAADPEALGAALAALAITSARAGPRPRRPRRTPPRPDRPSR